ncbi:YqaE/Pmp3 family membrane protein [Pseudoalteromonas sp. H105]|uniref:YqaE/Pmp3 family membrane protein n=1 Tax=Pseudoalteromonas sp. H105 TaxID=1348393 RepID=UPI0009E8962C|nr:YqaE/Pmp3 family membrane protein [Pseudoalteromonas sp. H105]
MDNKLILIILSLLLPPVAVLLKAGVGKHLVINIILCFILFIPAVIHSIWLCTR